MPKQTNHNPLTVSVDEAAAMLSLGRFKVYDLVNSGKIRARKEGTRILIRVTDLEAYLDSLPLVAEDVAPAS